jgi:antitoxin component YwqK of YwqJK toxin-antitoxin module
MYFDNDKYVFKSCGNYIVVLEKLEDTRTNELRTNITDPKYAKYRANKLKVLLIIHKFDPSDILEKVENSYYIKKVVYRTNEIIEIDDYDHDLNKVCTGGIHYFKTIEQAFFWELLKFNPKYTGKWILWYESGNKMDEGEYEEGKREGKWIEWYKSGNKMKEGEYKEGRKEGKWILWYESGNKMKEGEYKEGKWIEWHANGNKYEEGEYKEGEYKEGILV